MRDLHNNVHIRRVISPVSVADNTAQVGQIIDRLGFQSLEYVIATGSLADADATFTTLLQDGDASDMSDAATVAAADTLGTQSQASFVFSDDDKVFKLGYKGNKRYTRLTITPAANASAALVCAVAVLGDPEVAPTSNPPA